MDSKLVIEQMAGRWKVRHADMKPLALEAARLRPATVIWTWVPRELNKAADTLVNRALDGDPVPRHYLLDRPELNRRPGDFLKLSCGHAGRQTRTTASCARGAGAGLSSHSGNHRRAVGFPVEVQSAAEKAAAEPRLPDLDRTDLELITIDPDASRDLDQALHIARGLSGEFVISYAIADVAAFVAPGDAIDLEAHRRVSTLYAPDCRTPLHPPVLSEGAASLLPNEVRPALLWTITLDHRGQTVAAEVARARVRSRAQLSYREAQAEIDSGMPRETLGLLKLVGQWREFRERDRGGASLKLPQQEIQRHEDSWTLAFRAPEPVEGWNAQISLLTGMAAADIMLYGQVGILRTMPPADADSLRRLRQVAKALKIVWPPELDYPDFVRTLNPARPDHAAMLNSSTVLFRGAGYQSFSGGVPEDADHAALASDYAHTTAPLRRLVDRYSGEICVALCADQPVPTWVLRALDGLPEKMAAAERRAKNV